MKQNLSDFGITYEVLPIIYDNINAIIYKYL